MPDPVAPLVIAIHWSVVAAVHAHPVAVTTLNVPVLLPTGADRDVGFSANVHPCPWVTVNVRPAIVIVPVRDGPLAAATLNCTVPLPEPLLPCVTVIHGTLLAAVHGQPPGAVTATEPVPPAGVTVCDSGAIVKVHPTP